jgi:DNA-binding transcriptional ArsR family regulator
MLVAWKERFV